MSKTIELTIPAKKGIGLQINRAAGGTSVIETVKVNGTALVPVNKAVDVTVPTKTSDLTNDGDGTQGSAFATEDYLDENGGKIDVIKVNGTAQTITNKEVDLVVPQVSADQSGVGVGAGQTSPRLVINGSGNHITLSGQNNGSTVYERVVPLSDYVETIVGNVASSIPTNTSDLTNDSDFQTGTEVQTAIDNALADITGIDFEVVQTLPQTGEKGVIYLVANSGSAPNVYDEYIWIDGDPTGSFEKIGTTEVDLSHYWTDTSGQNNSLIAITTAEIDTLFA